MWTITEGVEICQQLFPIVKPFGYHVALIGSVLRDGKSDNDLDIAFLPYEDENIKVDWRQLESYLQIEFKSEKVQDLALPGEVEYEDSALRQVWKGQINSKEIDFFVYYC